jgi:hypothetical protein
MWMCFAVGLGRSCFSLSKLGYAWASTPSLPTASASVYLCDEDIETHADVQSYYRNVKSTYICLRRKLHGNHRIVTPQTKHDLGLWTHANTGPYPI